MHWRLFSLPELGLDGALSVDLARGPLGELLAFNARDVHPPLFYILLKGWLAVAGLSYSAAKFLAISGSMLALSALYALGRRLVGRAAGLLAALLLALSPGYQWLAPTVRDFGLGLFLSLLSILLTLRLADASAGVGRRAATAVALALCTAAALLTWYFHICALAAELAALASGMGRWGKRGFVSDTPHRSIAPLQPLAALAAGSILALPWYIYVTPHILGKLSGGITTFGGTPRLPAPADMAVGLVQAITGLPASGISLAAAAGWLVALLVGLFAARKGSDLPAITRAGRRLLVAGLLFACLEVGAVTLRWTDAGSLARYVLALLPVAVLLQAVAVTAGPRSLRAPALAGLVVLLPTQMVWYRDLATTPPIDWLHAPAVAYVVAHSQTGDALVFADRAARGRYLLNGGTLPAAVIHTAGQPYLADSAAEADAESARVTAQSQRIWFVENDVNGAAPRIGRQALAEHAYRVWQQPFGDTLLQLFLTGQPGPTRQLDLPLGGVISLDSAAFTASVSPGGPLAVELVWRDLQPPLASYAVFVHLDNAAGKTVAQQDDPPELGFRRTNTWHTGEVIDDRSGFMVPADLPAGQYRLNVGLYLGPKRLTLPDGGNAVELGVVHVQGP